MKHSAMMLVSLKFNQSKGGNSLQWRIEIAAV